MEAMTSEREAFEKWADENGYSIERLDGTYQDADTRNAWWGYCAAAESHLAQAQAVDVGVIEPVIRELRKWPKEETFYDHRATRLECADKLTRALSAQKAGPVGGGWQPIETAPKDGTPIFIPYCGRPVPAVWNEHDAEWRWVFLSHGRDNAHREAAVKLWHPMTLPASPTPDKEG